MSDELWVSRGESGYGSVAPGTGSPGALLQLIRIPGTVALYDPGRQIATGTTGQVLTDFSGRGNHAQLGSTSGVDTNDPAWSDNALVFDGTDDYVECPVTKTAHFTWLVACKLAETRYTHIVASDTGQSTGRGYVLGSSRTGETPYLASYAFQSTPNSPVAKTVFPINTPVVVGMRFGTAIDGMLGGAMVQTIPVVTSNTRWTAGLRIGASFRDPVDFLFKGNFYFCQMFNRMLTDAEYMRAYWAVESLLASRGVALA